MIQHILLDMDGVLADFVKGSLRVLGLPEDMPITTWDYPSEQLGMSMTAFWKKLDAEGEKFWLELEPYPWMSQLIEMVDEFSKGNWSISTSPSLSPECVAAKVKWLRKHIPDKQGKKFHEYMLGKQKYLMSMPGHVLIDDSDVNVARFEEYGRKLIPSGGGKSILFPQPWNVFFELHRTGNTIAFVRLCLEQFEDQLSEEGQAA